MTSPAVDLAARLGRTVLYQIYPQSFADADGDGIGDLAGIAGRLDYLAWLGVDAIWISPCFVSPFADAGYDVADFFQIAPRYGTNDDLARLTEEAGRRGISVLLDLVAGHTSDQHPWFRASADDPDDHRFVWSDVPVDGFEPGLGARGGYYLPNFFPVQPALNYGYARLDPAEPWRQPVDAAGPRANRAALREIMAHWFDLGVAGFRVDMASSLVKDDPGHVETGKLWREMRSWLDDAYPGRVLVSEWGNPRVSVPAGFHADFFLQFGGDDNGLPMRSLWNNSAGTVNPAWAEVPAWAASDARGDAETFARAWREAAEAIATTGRGGVVGLPTSNHDFTRLVAGERDAEQARVGHVLTMTWPAMPSVYYGDEIGMRYVPGTPTLEGSRLSATYDRSGSRTPMQWGDLPDDGTLGPGSPATSTYLPQDPDPDRPTVAGQLGDEDSLLHLVRELIALRHGDHRLDVESPVEVLATAYPMVYLRGGTLAVVLNPGRAAVQLPLDGAASARELVTRGYRAEPRAGWADIVHLEGHGYAVLDLDGS
ncbi:alpha-amylase family glycosyl hydrolase [Promicromonospora sp. NPDC023987]|uniref:alpha-amylase family glycosyl hydrolase n=1 Tax=Promicromonospora sp. NPDC023987 TaxID=3155360 RepID=UPI003407B874